MNERTKLMLLFQVPVVCLLLFPIIGLVLAYTFPHYIMGEVSSGYMTLYERDPARVWDAFYSSLVWPVFWFMASVPFELVLLHFDRVDEEKAKRMKPHRARRA